MKTKILILGAGNAQVDLIEYCKAAGYEVYGCSYTNTDKGIPLLDHFAQINIVDEKAVEQYAKEIQADIVYSVGSDIAMPTVETVCESLNLPHFVSGVTANICNTKDIMREKLGVDFEGNVPYKVIGSLEEAESIDFYPAIMKPVDSQGQRGVCEVAGFEDVKANYENSMSYSRQKRLIIERCIKGEEVSVNAFFENGRMTFGMVSDRIAFDEFPGGIIKKHVLPSRKSEKVQKQILDLARRVANRLSILNGPAYYQIIVKEDMPYLIEVTPRLDGCHMWRVIEHYCGINLLEKSMEMLGGHEASGWEMACKEGTYILEFVCQEPDTPMRMEIPRAVDFARLYYSKGDNVRRLNGFMEKCGYTIYREE